MLEIQYERSFKKDFKRMLKRGYNQEYLKVKYNKEKYLYKVILDQETNVKSYQLVEAA